MNIDFEDFLQEKHAEDYYWLDDDMPDKYEEWLSNLDIDTLIMYADQYAQQCYKYWKAERRLST